MWINPNARSIPRIARRSILKEQGDRCNLCPARVHVDECDTDHIIEWRNGGRSVRSNLQVLCKRCHKKKNRDFMRKLMTGGHRTSLAERAMGLPKYIFAAK